MARKSGEVAANARLYGYVALGTAIGGVARAAVSLAALRFAGPGFPWGTLAVNVVGSLAIGLFATLTAPEGRLLVSGRTRQFVMTGLCGGFTTFSVFSLETLHFAFGGHGALAALNVVVSVFAWLAAVTAGHAWATRLNRPGGG